MSNVTLPDLQLVVSYGTNKRILNGIGSNSVADHIRWSSVIPGGHHALSARIVDTERSGNTATYRYGATVTLRKAPAVGALAESGVIYWQGYLRTPTSNEDGTSDLIASGWHLLLQERDDALLWQARYYGDWQSGDAQGFSLGQSAAAIYSSINNASIGFGVNKGDDLKDQQHARIVWYYTDALNTQVLPRKVAGTIYKNVSLGATPNYKLLLERFDSPTANNTATTVNNYSGQLTNANIDDTGSTFSDTVAQSPATHPVIALSLWRIGDTGTAGAAFAFRVTIKDLRVSDLASSDTYVSSSVIADLAANSRMGFTSGAKVTATSRNILPLFWTNGTWWDLVDYLATAEAYKWAVWEMNPLPELEFRAWNTGTVWTTNSFGATATTIAQLQPDDELYNVVDVSYTQGQSSRIRHARTLVSPDPFAGLTPARVRTFKYALQDPQPDNVLALAISASLASEYGTEQLSGTATGSYFTSGTDQTSYAVRAGDRLTLSDYPGGPQTVRITGVDHSDAAPSVLTFGRVPSDLTRMLFWANQRKRRRGTI